MYATLDNDNRLCFLDKKGGVFLALTYKDIRKIAKLIKGDSEEEVRIGPTFFSVEGDFFIVARYKRGSWVEWVAEDTEELQDILETLKGILTEVGDYG